MKNSTDNITAEDLESVSPYLFIKANNIKNEQGIPLSFKDRAFLIEILEDRSPLQVILKAPQIGMTVLQLIKSLWWAFYEKKDLIYTLPTETDVQEMAGGKINRIIAQNPVFLDWIKHHDTVSQKTVGQNIIHYRGTWTTKAAMMVSSQLNIHDEVDVSNPEVLTQYETRLQSQPGGMRWYFSHPSMLGAGIDIQWEKSDQKEWFVKCKACNEIQFLEWPHSIDQERQCYQCKFCGAEITDQQRREGYNGIHSWKKLYPDAEFSGYHISQLMCAWIPASKIIKDFKEKEAQYFANYTFALPYADNRSKVTLETIKGLLTEETTNKGRVIFGVDTGLKIRWVCGDMNGLKDMGEVESYNDLQREVDRYKDWIMVIDQGGDIIGVREFAEKNPGKVFLCYFQQDKKQLSLIKWGEGDEYGMVRCDRNRLIQLVVDEMNDKRTPLQGDLQKWWNLWLHWQFMYRVVEEDRVGNLVYVWECDKSAHRNDWALAQCYWRVGIDRFAQNEVQFIAAKKENDTIPWAPYRTVDGQMQGKAIELTLPVLPEKESDWRFN